jgi:1,6-anhydro-N-acetylmuramate kinase
MVEPSLPFAQAVSLLNDLAGEAIFQPETAEMPIQILEALQAAGSRFDALWAMGMTDTVWPAPAKPNPIIPRILQREFDLPHATPERELRFARDVTDRLLRSANTVSGGQGAPITPLADFVLFADTLGPKLVMNLGGFINVTLVPTLGQGVDAIRGFDVCACNHLLDRVARTRLGAPFDADGAAASRGTADTATVRRIADAIAPAAVAGTTRRSLGTGDDAARLVELTAPLAPDDACRTVVEAIASAAVRVIESETGTSVADIRIAGGSARHRALQAALARRTGATVRTTAESDGIPVHMREASEIAILGALADDGVRYSLPQVTGAASVVPESAVLEAAAGNAVSSERTQV